MARFHARLENGAGDFREIRIYADTLEEARAALTRRELKFVIHRLPADKVAEIEAKIADGTATKPEIVELQLHNQDAPYEIVYLDDKPRGRQTEKAEA